MKRQNRKVFRFKIFKKGNEYCAETVRGRWRILKFSENEISVSESDKKPDQFKQFVLMTEREMLADEIDLLYCDYYYAKHILEGAKTLTDAAEMLREQANYLEELENSGWQLVSTVKSGYGELECQLKPFDSVDAMDEEE